MEEHFEVSTVNQGLLSHNQQRHFLQQAINPLRLDLFQRILLATDGTATKFLEAYTGESMQVVELSRAVTLLDQTIPCLEPMGAHAVLSRRILLQGKLSLTYLLYSESMIILDRLEKQVRDGLLESDKPIDQLLLEHRIETFKEFVSYGRETAGPLSKYFQIEDLAPMICRTYKVFSSKCPIMLITEKFPESYFLSTEGY